ncbi:MAG TPA: CheR family methyltransferase [Bacteroidota bacterium]|nr:CheR family methyltransferase [Bacteroidota bacterium]
MAFTFFFRDTHILDLVAKHVVPDVTGYSRVRVWDAGCAMGPEPYSLAIYLAENMGRFAFRNINILATDIDESGGFGKIIEEGIYSDEELKRIPRPLFDKYFEAADRPGHFRINESIRSSIKFQYHDLLSLQPPGNTFHMIMCKNVLLHFSPKQRVEVIRMFHSVLTPGGWFCTEQTQKMPEENEHLFARVGSDGQLFRRV